MLVSHNLGLITNTVESCIISVELVAGKNLESNMGKNNLNAFKNVNWSMGLFKNLNQEQEEHLKQQM